MTVKELKEKLNEFPDHLVVMVPNVDWMRKLMRWRDKYVVLSL